MQLQRPRHRSATAPHATRRARRCAAVVCKASAAQSGAGEDAGVRDGRLPLLQQLQQFVSPLAYARAVLSGARFAWGKTGLPPRDTLFIADLEATRLLLGNEFKLGIGGDWPPTFKGMIGHDAVSMTEDLELHVRLRQVLGGAFTRDGVQAMLPGLYDTAAEHLARWAAASSGKGADVEAYPLVRLLTFSVLVNQALGVPMGQEEVARYSGLFKTLVDGFVPPAWDLPFTPYGKGMAARRELVARITAAMSDPGCSGTLARLRDEFGAGSVAIDNAITLLFAGFDTTSSSITFMLALLGGQHPGVLKKVAAEQAEVVGKHGDAFTPAAYAAMPYTLAVVKESLRLAAIIAYVPRLATQELHVPHGPTLPAGCPFIMALAALGASDPALQTSSSSGHGAEEGGQAFRPERWLDPAAAQSLALHQLPFGSGQRTCLGMHLAYAEMAAVLAVLGRHYDLTADGATAWQDFPIKRPLNGLPMRLTPRSSSSSGGGAAAAVGQAAIGV